MLLILTIGLWTTLLAARCTAVGALLHRVLVAAPAARLSRVRRGTVLLTLLLGTIVLGLIWLFQEEGRMLVAFGLPDVVSFAAMIDLGSLLDVALVAVVAAGSVRLRAVGAWLRSPAPGMRRARAVRMRRDERRAPAANDDEDRTALAA